MPKVQKVQARVKDLVIANQSALNTRQIQSINKKTHSRYVKQRPGKGGATWNYVAASHVVEVLNKVFGYAWSFEVLTPEKDALDIAIKTGCVAVKGSLTVLTDVGPIVKQQFGRKEVAVTKAGKILDFGNDMKAAASDALKKCASELGMFKDVYAPEDYLEIDVIDDEQTTVVQQEVQKEAEDAKKVSQIAEVVKDAQPKMNTSTQYGRMRDVVAASKQRMDEILQANDSNTR